MRALCSLFMMGVAMANQPAPPELRDFDEQWNYSEPARTAEEFRRILEDTRASRDDDYIAQLLTQLARAEGLQQHFDEAHALLDEAEDLIKGSMSIARARLLLERGRLHNSSGDPDRARPLFLEAWELTRSHGHDFHAIDAAHMLEIASPLEEKIDWNLAACEIAEATSNPRGRRWLGSLYNNRGWSLHELGRLDEALAVFEQRLEYLRSDDPREDQIAIARWSIAKTLRLLGRAGDALVIQQELARTTSDDGYVYEELGECLLALGRTDEARPHFARAHALLKDDPWLARDEAERLARLERLGAGDAP
jgi:tetratricopeptide (TPR) repeat protein